MNIVYFLVISIIIVGLTGFFKVAKFIHIIPAILQCAIIVLLLYLDVKVSPYLFAFLIFPYFWMYLGYKEIFSEIKKLINYIKNSGERK